MDLVIQYLNDLGFSCKDTSSAESYDLLASRQHVPLKIEVKGTTSDICDSILMTKNEVELHRAEKGLTGLIIVSGIKLNRIGYPPTASGGIVETLLEWDIGQ